MWLNQFVRFAIFGRIRICLLFNKEFLSLPKNWPREEKYALKDQVRRSSRSVGANIAEAWAKRRYPSHFVSKLCDADGELQETSHWLATALACEYIAEEQHASFQKCIEEIGRSIGKMMSIPQKFTPKSTSQ